MVQDHFATLLNEPVPLSLARAIETAGQGRKPLPEIASGLRDGSARSRELLPVMRAIAASLVLVAGGALGGWIAADVAGRPENPAWLQDIADYHRVYAAEKRHLAEVPASEKDHIETWLTKVVGVPVKVPDLAAEGLTFEGGRLLVAASKPVAQLMFRRADGSVVALCMISAARPGDGSLTESVIGETGLVSWTDEAASYVVAGAATDAALAAIARAAAPQV
jgi:anti-sigma factor RsiW